MTRKRKMTRTNLGPHFSEGSRQIFIFCETNGLQPREVSKKLGFCLGLLHRHMWGDQRPDLASGIAYEDVLGINPRLFFDPPRRRFVLPALRSVASPRPPGVGRSRPSTANGSASEASATVS